ncbi:MAG TPA: hypothetical protein VFM68_01530 [Candidatus Saccharimonadales bacterium]|nr:hypothetical protein [Candidatus Saccharimonadales bacterium]
MSQQTVTINGVIYDALTGLPLQKATHSQSIAPRTTTPIARHSQHVHHATQKSATLNRTIVKQTTSTAKQIDRPVVQKNPAIKKFAPHPIGAKQSPRSMDIGPISHPLVVRAQQKTHAVPKPTTVAVEKSTHAPKPSQVIKQEAIAEALDKAPRHNAKVKQVKQSGKKRTRAMSIASASLALMMLAGYFTYLNMPNLSVRVAAAQAGFDATYPGYHPDGYRVDGPVAYNDGWVSMKFTANGGSQNFTVKQEKSGWDSSALLAKYVEPSSDGGYVPYNEQGLTVYVFDNNAAWVNDGVRYTIEGNAPLSSSQILAIATSM